MLQSLPTALASGEGLLFYRELKELGENPRRISHAVASGEIVRVHAGVFVLGERWQKMSPEQRYAAKVHAVARASRHPLLLSHLSAAALHGLPLIGSWPSTVHALSPGAAGGSSRRAVTLHTRGADAEPLCVDGLLVTTLTRTLIDIASTCSFLVAVVMLDHALHTDWLRYLHEISTNPDARAPLAVEDLLVELDRVNPRTGKTAAARAIVFADRRSASPGESLSRVRMHELRFLMPDLQVTFRNIEGHDYEVDFFWRSLRKIGEFDGLHKYQRAEYTNGLPAGEIVWKEKRREDALRKATRNSFLRWPWDIVLPPATFARFLREGGIPQI